MQRQNFQVVREKKRIYDLKKEQQKYGEAFNEEGITNFLIITKR